MFFKKENIPAAFVIPIINGKIYLAKRNTKPHKNYYGPIGGKIDSLNKINKEGLYREKPEELYEGRVTAIDELLINEKFEHTKEAAIREFCEEIFSDKKYPEDFSKNDFSNIFSIGSIVDSKSTPKKNVYCNFYIVQINRTDFKLSQREISDFDKIENINEKDIFPIGKLALYFFKFLIGPYRIHVNDDKNLDNFSYLFEQIPEFKMLDSSFETAMNNSLSYRDAKIRGEDEISALKYAGFLK